MDALKQFVFNGLLTENALAQLGAEGISVQSPAAATTSATVTDVGFSPRTVYDASKMAVVYTAFFCLENAVRDLITERLLARKGPGWWTTAVPSKIRTAVEKLREKEGQNKYHTGRSSALVGYTMFGHLGQIIISNWDDFSDLFPDQAWVTARFNDLEMSRNIIMHTGILPVIEIERIQSIGRDWLRQVG